MRADSEIELKELRVDGGATANDSLMQFQADILQIPVVRPQITETTALGAAYLAGLAVGFWRSPDDLKSYWRVEKVFEPQMKLEKVKEMRERWNEAVKRTLNWKI